MKRRMNNIFRSDGKAFVLALDHAAMMPSPDLHDAGHVIREAVSGGADAFLTTYGMIKNFQKEFGNTGLIMRADGGISSLRKPMDRLDLLYSAEDAVRVGADAMLCMGYPGSTDNEHSLKYLAKLCADGEKFGRMIQYSSMHPDSPILISPQMLHRSEIVLTGGAISPDEKNFYTANRLLSTGIINCKPLIAKKFHFEEAQKAFEASIVPGTFRVIIKD